MGNTQEGRLAHRSRRGDVMTVLKQDRERLIKEWQTAFEAANDKPAPSVTWSHGWYWIQESKFRRAKLEEMRDVLIKRAAEVTGEVEK